MRMKNLVMDRYFKIERVDATCKEKDFTRSLGTEKKHIETWAYGKHKYSAYL